MHNYTCVICDCNVVYLAIDVLFHFPETIDGNFSLLENSQLKMERMRYSLFGM